MAVRDVRCNDTKTMYNRGRGSYDEAVANVINEEYVCVNS